MNRRLVLALLRAAFAALAIYAMAFQAKLVGRCGHPRPAQLPELLHDPVERRSAAVVFLVGAVRFRQPATPGWDLVRGASALNMTVTYVVFALLLANTDVDVTHPWVNTVVHVLFPLVVMADWVVDPPAHEVS